MSSSFIPRHRRWNAKWIWTGGDGKEPNTYVFFRREISLSSVPKGVIAYIAADTRYQLFINGEFIGRGAPQSQPFYQYYDERDIGRFLTKGKNCIAVMVNHVGNLADTRGGLLCEIVAGLKTLCATDASWKCIRSDAWQGDTHMSGGNKATPYQEFFDARKFPDGWNKTGFNDAKWQDAAILRGRVSDRPPAVTPWSKLVPRDIPFMSEYPVLAQRVHKIEESLDLINRSRPNDLAPTLSLVGGPVKYTRVDAPENLARSTGQTIVQCSTNHKNLDFDGLYAPAIILDFGKVMTARSRIVLTVREAGGMVDIGYAERLIDGNFNIAMECEFADRYIMKAGQQTFTSFGWRAFRYLKLRFRSCFEPVTIHSVEGVVTTYPYDENGGFSSGDNTLNRVFEISRETIKLCSNEFIMDTPWREQAQWLGDVALVTAPAIYACFGDVRLVEKFIAQSAQNQLQTGMISNVSNSVSRGWENVIPDYSLWWVQGLLYHYLYSGDRSWIDRFYPQALRIIYAHLEYVNERGLIEDMPYWAFVDWAFVDKRGECAVYNAIFYGTLEAIGEIAKLKDDAYTIALVKTLRGKIKSNFHKRFYDAKRGCYADARIDGVFSERTSEHANAAAIAFGLCERKIALSIAEMVFEKRAAKAIEAQPFFMAVVLKALDGIGRFDLALKLIRDRWGKRMLDKGCTSVLEEWYQNGSWRDGYFKCFLRTHSHAWSACPADFLIRNFIGLEIVKPGCSVVKVKPKKTGFDYDVKFPTPAGVIAVSNKGGVIKVSTGKGITVRR